MSSTPRSWPTLLPLLLAVSCAAGAVLTSPGHAVAQEGGSAAPPAIVPATRRYVSDYQLRTGEELVFVMIGASFCGAHRTPGFPQAVEDAKVAVQRQAKAGGLQFRAVAVSLDWRPKDALAFLDAFGEFDELSVGSNWVNEGAFRYIWNDARGDPVVPQVLVLRRRVETGDHIRVTGEEVVRRLRGSDEILAWVRSGAPT